MYAIHQKSLSSFSLKKVGAKSWWKRPEVSISSKFYATFLYESALHSFSLLKVWLCNFLAQEYVHKNCSLNVGEIDPNKSWIAYLNVLMKITVPRGPPRMETSPHSEDANCAKQCRSLSSAAIPRHGLLRSHPIMTSHRWIKNCYSKFDMRVTKIYFFRSKIKLLFEAYFTIDIILYNFSSCYCSKRENKGVLRGHP